MNICDDTLQIVADFINDEPNILLYLRQEGKEKILERLETDWFNLRHTFANASEDFLMEFKDDISWDIISIYRDDITENFIQKFMDVFDWSNFTNHHCKYFELDFISYYRDYVDWQCVSRRRDLPLNFIEDFMDKLDLFILLQENELPQWFVHKHKESFLASEKHARDGMYSRGSFYSLYFHEENPVLVEEYLEDYEPQISLIDLPQDLVDIIIDYKDQLDFSEHKEKYSKCMKELHNNFQECYECGELAFDRYHNGDSLQEVNFSCYECLADWADQDMAEEAWLYGDF